MIHFLVGVVAVLTILWLIAIVFIYAGIMSEQKWRDEYDDWE